MGCEGCAKFVLIAFNIVFFLLGAAALAVGIWVAVDGTIFLQLLSNIPNSGAYGKLIGDAAYVLIAVGAVIFIIAFLGCCGAIKTSKCLLVSYGVIVSVLLLMQIAAVIVAAFFSGQVITIVKDDLSKALGATYNSTFVLESGSTTTYTYKSSDILSKGIDAVQLQFTCCGINGYDDYMNRTLAVTCCKTTTSSGDLNTLVNKIWGGSGSFDVSNAACPNDYSTKAGVTGCYDSVKQFVLDRAYIFIGIGAGILVVQLVLIVLACCVGCRAGKSENFA